MTTVPPSPLRRSVTGHVLVVAHRGLSAEEPENTMRSFRRAAEVGCDLIELDVHLSSDGVPVVIHDETLERTTDGHGRVTERTWKELRTLDAGRGERIPSLEEVVTWAVAGSIGLSVEIKQPTPALGLPPYDGIADRVVGLLRSAALDRCLVHSFDHPKVTFRFTANERVDFRVIVKELAGRFRARIQMQQVGARDEAKYLGGLGLCGLVLCCASFLTEFKPITMKMVRVQGLPLDDDKLLGLCGRLKCCLAYEYEEGSRALPLHRAADGPALIQPDRLPATH